MAETNQSSNDSVNNTKLETFSNNSMHLSKQIKDRKLLINSLEEEMIRMHAVVSDFLYFHRQLSTCDISFKDSQPTMNDSKDKRRNSVLPSLKMQDRKKSVATLVSETILNNNSSSPSTKQSSPSNSLFTLIFHGLQEDWLEKVGFVFNERS